MTPSTELGLAYHHVDVFADQPLRGNGLIVVTSVDQLATALMQEITREMRQFESIFLSAVDLPGRQATARIFTLDEELVFAGHPVLGRLPCSTDSSVTHPQRPGASDLRTGD